MLMDGTPSNTMTLSARYVAIMKSCSTTKAVFLAWRMNLERGGGREGEREGRGRERREEGVTTQDHLIEIPLDDFSCDDTLL